MRWQCKLLFSAFSVYSEGACDRLDSVSEITLLSGVCIYRLCNGIVTHGAPIGGIWVSVDHKRGNKCKRNSSTIFTPGLQKMFSLSGTIKSNGQNFLSNMCTKHSSQAHNVKSLWAGFRPRAFWRSLVQSAPIFEPFLCKYYYFVFFSFEHFLRGQFFFWDRRSHGPVDFVGLLHALCVVSSVFTFTLRPQYICTWRIMVNFIAKNPYPQMEPHAGIHRWCRFRDLRSIGPFILHRNCVALPHCTLLHRNCDVTALRCRMKVKFISTWNAVMLRWLAAERSWHIDTATQLRCTCSMNRPYICVMTQLIQISLFTSGHFHVKVDMGVKISNTSESSKFGLKWKLKVCILMI